MSTEIEKEMEGVVRLDKDFTLKKDLRCWTLLYRRDRINPKTGKPTMDYQPSYYPTLATAIQAYLDHRAKRADKTVESLLTEVRAGMARIEEIFKDVPSALSAMKAPAE